MQKPCEPGCALLSIGVPCPQHFPRWPQNTRQCPRRVLRCRRVRIFTFTLTVRRGGGESFKTRCCAVPVCSQHVHADVCEKGDAQLRTPRGAGARSPPLSCVSDRSTQGHTATQVCQTPKPTLFSLCVFWQ